MWVPDHKTFIEDGLIREARAADRERAVMSERIDHAAEAKRIMAKNSSVGGVDAVASSIDAQTHATLALVEQQRIANRIAIAAAIREDLIWADDTDKLREWVVEGRGVRGYFSVDEQEALGLS